MNKALALVAFLCLNFIAVVTVKAQTEKGKQTVGLEFGFSSSKGTSSYKDQTTGVWSPTLTSKGTSFSFTPSYGYFIADKLDLNAGLSYGQANGSTDGENFGDLKKSNTKAFSVSLALRKYFLFENKIGVRVGPYVNYGFTNRDYDYIGSTETSRERLKDYAGGIGLDFVYYPTTRLGLAAKLGDISYAHNKTNNSSNIDKKDQFNLSFMNSLSLNLFYTFGGSN